MPSGRLPTPTPILEMTGATKHNPQQYRNRRANPKPEGGLLDPPEHLDDGRRAIWRELEGQIAVGVLTHSDMLAFEVLVSMAYDFRADPARYSAARLMTLISLLARFGMTPSDRTRIKVTPSGDSDSTNPFASFHAETRRTA